MDSLWIEEMEDRWLMSAGPMAGEQLQAGARVAAGDVVQLQTQSRLQDGSCQTASCDLIQQRTQLRTGRA